MSLTGHNIIGFRLTPGTDAAFQAADPSAGQSLEPTYAAASASDVDNACALAAAAFDAYRSTTPDARAAFLERIATEIEAVGEALVDRAMRESGLPRGRLEGERGRTCGQLRLFAQVLRQGDWLGVRIDPAQPERTPQPRADIRQQMIPLGPVAVFGASNFPLAFSVAGGDTASALAAGCPVVCKGHPAHPGTGEIVGRAIVAAAQATGMPEGVFSLLNGASNALGAALVDDPRIKAVGFTGSRSGGLSLWRAAQTRPEPIPVYAEMSSINPVVLLPGALAARAKAIAQGFVASLTLGAGQFCTNPGLVIALDGPDLDRFITEAAKVLTDHAPAPMLTSNIHAAYEAGVQALSANAQVKLSAQGLAAAGPNQGRAALFETTSDVIATHPELLHEVFGAASIVVRCPSIEAVIRLIDALEGQLTITLQMDSDDDSLARRLLPRLELKAGRIVANGWPTGVEVGHSMVHGGPFPATTDSRATSVGSLAIARFLRPVCYQDHSRNDLLPPALQAANPLDLPRRLDGRPA